MGEYTLCWDCANSTKAGCSWASEFESVKGWQAIKTRDSYKVLDCPEFDRDSYGFGQNRTLQELIEMENKRKRWGSKK